MVAIVLVAAARITSEMITVVPSGNPTQVGTIVRSTYIPEDAIIFGDEDEVMTTMKTGQFSTGSATGKVIC